MRADLVVPISQHRVRHPGIPFEHAWIAVRSSVAYSPMAARSPVKSMRATPVRRGATPPKWLPLTPIPLQVPVILIPPPAMNAISMAMGCSLREFISLSSNPSAPLLIAVYILPHNCHKLVSLKIVVPADSTACCARAAMHDPDTQGGELLLEWIRGKADSLFLQISVMMLLHAGKTSQCTICVSVRRDELTQRV